MLAQLVTKLNRIKGPYPGLTLASGLLVFVYIAFVLHSAANLSLVLLTLMAFVWVPYFLYTGELRSCFAQSVKTNRYILGGLLFYSIVWIVDVGQSSLVELSDFERPLKVLLCVLLFLYFSVVRVDARFVVAGLCASLLFFSVLLYQGIGTAEDNRYGLGLNQNALAYLVTAEVLLLTTFCFIYRNFWYRIVIFSFVVLGVVVSSFTGSRVIFLCYGGFVVVFLLIIWRQLTLRSLILVLLFSVASIFVASSNETISSRFSEVQPELESIFSGNYSGSIGHRAGLYELWFLSIEDYFPVGARDDGLKEMAELSFDRGQISATNRDWLVRYSHFHNEYFNTLIFRGLLGLLSLISIVAAPLLVQSKPHKLLLFAALSPLTFGGLVDVPLAGGTYLVFSFLMMALLTNLRIDISNTEPRSVL